MTTALLIALLNASPSILAAVMKIIVDIHNSGHPDDAPLKPEHVAAITTALALSATDILGDPDGPE